MPTKEKAKHESQTSKIGVEEEIVPAESEATSEEADEMSPESRETKTMAVPRQMSREELEALRSKLQKKFH
jgi:hypothetical protein